MSSLYFLPAFATSWSSFIDSLLSSSFSWFSPSISRRVSTPPTSRNSIRYLWLQRWGEQSRKYSTWNKIFLPRISTLLGTFFLPPCLQFVSNLLDGDDSYQKLDLEPKCEGPTWQYDVLPIGYQVRYLPLRVHIWILTYMHRELGSPYTGCSLDP